MKMKYLISGIGPGASGVGRLMRVLVPEYEKKGYRIIYRREPKSVKSLIKGKRYFSAFMEFFRRLLDYHLFRLKTFVIKESEVVFLHPQTAGFDTLLRLSRSNKVSLYVMDNSFFCIQSYNTHPSSNKECLNCLGNINPHELCRPYPVRMEVARSLGYLGELKKMSSLIDFYAQNELQKSLLEKHFGGAVNVSVIGMDTGELHGEDVEKNSSQSKCYDFVFHGASIIPKGILFVVELAERLPEYNFLIPDDKGNVVSILGRTVPDNIDFMAVSWESGLKELVVNARIVLNPSMWSAPIEGALIKSAAFNENVATVATMYGYEKEADIIKNHIRLDSNPEVAAEFLRGLMAQLKPVGDLGK